MAKAQRTTCRRPSQLDASLDDGKVLPPSNLDPAASICARGSPKLPFSLWLPMRQQVALAREPTTPLLADSSWAFFCPEWRRFPPMSARRRQVANFDSPPWGLNVFRGVVLPSPRRSAFANASRRSVLKRSAVKRCRTSLRRRPAWRPTVAPGDRFHGPPARSARAFRTPPEQPAQPDSTSPLSKARPLPAKGQLQRSSAFHLCQ